MHRVAIAALAFLSATAVSAAAPDATPKEERVRCKRMGETGSLAKVVKVCRTEREWQEALRQAQSDTDQVQQNARVNSAAPQ